MLFLYESFANEAFKSHQLISSASVFAKTTLHIRDKLVFFQVPHQSVIVSTLFPRCIIGFLQVKKHGNYMLFLYESFA